MIFTCVQDAVKLLIESLAETISVGSDSCLPLRLINSSLTNSRVGVTLGEHDLLVVFNGSLPSLVIAILLNSGSNSSCCNTYIHLKFHTWKQ